MARSNGGTQPRRLARIAAIACFSALAAAWFFARSPARVEKLYSEGAFPWIASALSRISAPFPFSLAEPLLAAATLGALASAAGLLRKSLRGRGQARRAWIAAAWNWSAAAGCALAAGYLLWGLNYARPDAVGRLRWQTEIDHPHDPAELPRLCAQAIELANRSRGDIGGGGSGGADPGAPGPTEWDPVLDAGFAAAAETLGLEPIFRVRLAPAKPVWASGLLSRFGISGFYFPWTGEANFNASTNRFEQIHAIAHEKAHQRGVASEDEANFYGYLACVHSDDEEVRYAGRLFAQRQLLRQLGRVDPEAAAALAARRSPEVQADEAAIQAFWKQFQGPVGQVGAAVNDSYLRLHRVPGGLASYDRSARLLVLLARRQGGLR